MEVKINMPDHITTFRVPIEKIPEAKSWAIGGRYQMVADVEQVGINKERDYGTDGLAVPSVRGRKEKPKYKTMVEFKVHNVSAKGEALKKKKER